MPPASGVKPGAPLAQEFTEGRKTAMWFVSDAPEGSQQAGPVVAVATGARRGLARAVVDAFLPSGFPSSVSNDYLTYQVWDSIQGLSSYVRGMLSSQAMLAGVGVGSAAATPLGAVFQFFIKDFTGMLGGIIFASTQGAGLDCYAKQWRLLADIMNDIGLALELASPLLPGAFLLLACLGSLARAVTGVAGGATRMALTQHFALQHNSADIAAKEGSQETAVTLVGMLLGMALLHLASGLQPLIWAAFLALTTLHVYANVRAMRCLRITSLNQARLGLLLWHFLCQGEVLTPEQMAVQESLVPPPLARLLRWLGLGFGGVPLVGMAPRLASLNPVLQRQLAAQAQVATEVEMKLRRGGNGKQYLAAAVVGGGGGFGSDAVVLLRQSSGPLDVLEGYCAALMLAWNVELAAGGSKGPSSWPAPAQLALADVDAWLAATASSGRDRKLGPHSGNSYEGFLAVLAATGWALDRIALLQGPSRLAWGTDLHGK